MFCCSSRPWPLVRYSFIIYTIQGFIMVVCGKKTMEKMCISLKAFCAIIFSVQIMLILCGGVALASDHIDGEITINNQVADITDLFVFPSPKKLGHLVMIMNSYPFVKGNGHFSDRLSYNFNIRRVSGTGNGVNSGFELHEAYNFKCIFEPTDKRHAPAWINCTGPENTSVRAKVDTVQEASQNQPFRVFAGHRADPFIFNGEWFQQIALKGNIPRQATNSNDSSGLNILSIVLEVDTSKVFNQSEGTLFAVAVEILELDTSGGNHVRIDRAGRPEISNARLAKIKEKNDLRNSYNAEANFDTSGSIFGEYHQRILENINYYDELDGVEDWLPEWRKTLAKLLLNDFLVVDISKPYSKGGYFEIENAMLRNLPNSRSGGRTPDQNILNSIFSLMVNGGHGPEINSGIPAEENGMKMTFPYLQESCFSFFGWIKTLFGKSVSEKLSLEARSRR
ncbi:MAG: DUF4331 domain-containing protein [Candidatus Electrothrix sp. GM3_4]|nr:DUF4331 domain-containing protein [Candidatus Electrothrix sp. GM3_4]